MPKNNDLFHANKARADKGDPEAMHYIGWCYIDGVDVKKEVVLYK